MVIIIHLIVSLVALIAAITIALLKSDKEGIIISIISIIIAICAFISSFVSVDISSPNIGRKADHSAIILTADKGMDIEYKISADDESNNKWIKYVGAFTLENDTIIYARAKKLWYKSEETYREAFVSNGLIYFREVDIPPKETETEEDDIITTTAQVKPEEKETTETTVMYRYRTVTPVEKFTEWSDWSDWTSELQYESDLKEVEAQTVYGYYYYQCPYCNNRMHGWDIVDFAWAGGCGIGQISYDDYRQIWSPLSYAEANLQDFHGTGKMVTYSIDGQRWFKWEDPNGAPNIVTGYRYRTRTSYTETEYSEWSKWSEYPVEDSENIEVETKIVT